MKDVSETSTTGWLLLIHQIPPKPDYLRVKVGRRLQRVGAIAIKNSVYVLPQTEDSYEDFQWIAREIEEANGEALVCEGTLVSGLSDADLRGRFGAARDADYEEIRAEAVALLDTIGDTVGSGDATVLDTGRSGEIARDLARLRRRLDAIIAIDFFGQPAREGVIATFAQVTQRLRTPSGTDTPGVSDATGGGAGVAPHGSVHGRTWVTRQDVHVDRLASAWLIRRFIDCAAVFKFVPAKGYEPIPGEVRFDMYEAEYTHQGQDCSFETLLRRFQIDDAALATIAEIVHDVDCKDAKFGRAEAAGVAQLVAGIAASTPDDESRLERGNVLFDTLYASFG
jgi:hypothetical protein